MVKGRFWKKDRGRGRGRTEAVSMLMGRAGGRCTTGEGEEEGADRDLHVQRRGKSWARTPAWS